MSSGQTTAAPSTPGVYVFMGSDGRALYVGKSRNLKQRVLEHLKIRVEKDALIVGSYSQVEFLPTRNEREALLLEANLIREMKPRYNVLMKDDRSYPYIQVTTGEKFPRISFVRRPIRKKGVTLFGPYTRVRDARSLMHLVQDTFHLRRCTKLPSQACIYYHMGLCPAPCIGAIGEKEYRDLIEEALLVLQGRPREVVVRLEKEMRAASDLRDYERAAVLRDAISAVRNLKEEQSVTSSKEENMDFLALHHPVEKGNNVAVVCLLRVRDGQVVGAEPHQLTLPDDVTVSGGEILSEYIMQNYADRGDSPKTLYVPVMAEPDIADLREAMDFLLSEKGIETWVAATGRPRSLIELAGKAAETQAHSRPGASAASQVLEEVQKLISLPQAPRRIEGVDISLFQGSEPVGSVVHFLDGQPEKSEYRRFKIREVEGTNDLAMIHEVVGRRLGRLKNEGGELPDLLLIDGGAGQVSHAMEAVAELGLVGKVSVVGLAKKNEELYLPGARHPIKPDRNSAPMLLLRRVRDEAHRFAVTYHRKRRKMAMRSEFASSGPKSLKR